MGLVEYDISTSFPAEAGLSWLSVQALEPELSSIVELLVQDWRSGLLPFLGLPDESPDLVVKLAEEARARFDRLVVLGIGGSALGARAVIEALTGPRTGAGLEGTERRSVWFHESVDPVELRDLLDAVDWDRTLWNVVTKSGSTIETLSSYFIVREELEKRFDGEGVKRRLLMTTDRERGALRELVRAEGLASLGSSPGVGGRYSVLSPAGLFPAAFAGVDVTELLSGAAQARDRALGRHVLDNPAAVFAALQVLHYREDRHIVVFMPYATVLQSLAEWFSQLWAESLGKRRGEHFVGPTPARALGVRDQHSQLQLYMEGPRDKNIVFVEVCDFRESLKVPMSRAVPPELLHLCGKELSEILAAELAGTRQALTEEGCPTSTLRLRDLSAEAVGALMMMLEVATAIAGALFEVDPFNQPGVELGKRYAHGLLGRTKESHYADSLVAAEAERERRVLTT